MRFLFSKYSGCGNDFIIIDNRPFHFPQHSDKIQQLCQRQTGIGADGIILLENSQTADFGMRIYNADGSEADMCGNGIRCLMKFLQELGFRNESYTIQTSLRKLTLTTLGSQVAVNMGEAFDHQWHLPLEVDGKTYQTHYLNTGVPHTILFTDNLDIDFEPLGLKFRNHTHFGSKGTNFNLAKLMPNGELHNRTFERGVEGETLACGTGCAAVAMAAINVLGLSGPIKVRTRTQDLLEFSLLQDTQEIMMTGPATKVFEGAFELES